MIFVHSRKDTVLTASTMIEIAKEEGCLNMFDPSRHPQYGFAKVAFLKVGKKIIGPLFTST
jgi:hypothetical protein